MRDRIVFLGSVWKALLLRAEDSFAAGGVLVRTAPQWVGTRLRAFRAARATLASASSGSRRSFSKQNLVASWSALFAATLAAFVPMGRCHPVDGDRHATVVLLGEHVHDGHGHGHGGHAHGPAVPHGADPDDEQSVPGDPCCHDHEQDVYGIRSSPARAPTDAVPAVLWHRARLDADLRAVPAIVPSADVPVPRSPTRTIVLLR